MNGQFEYYIETNNFHFKYAMGKPSAIGQEFHDYDEIIFFLNGDAQFISKDIQIVLKPNNMILVPKEHFHQFIVKRTDDYTRCIIAFKETPKTKRLIRDVMCDIALFPVPSRIADFIISQMIKTVKSNLKDDEKILSLEASIVNLLIELKQASSKRLIKDNEFSDLTRQALSFIDSHFSENLTVDKISKELNVSVSTLSHKFRKELNMPVYSYISKKRLSAVRQYIEKGETLSNAALLSGFKDYSNFFRIYKNLYGKSPSENLSSFEE